MSAKHTPGPWRVIFYDAGDRDYYDHNGPCPGIYAPDEQDCAIVHWDGFKQRYWASANGKQDQIEANARLIAAAPDLLEALVEILGPLGVCSDNANVRDDVVLPIEMTMGELRNARAAIAKAKGTPA